MGMNPQQMMMMQGKGMMGPMGGMPGKGMPQMQGGMPMMQGKGMPQMQGGMPMMQGKGGAPPPAPNPNAALSAATLAAASPAMQKQMIGEKLFASVAKQQPELAGKITGMMLEMDNSELLILLESESQLKLKIDEAMRVLQGK